MKKLILSMLLIMSTLSVFSQFDKDTFVFFTTVEKWTFTPKGLFKNKLATAQEKNVNVKIVLSKETLCLTEDVSGFGVCGEIDVDNNNKVTTLGMRSRTITLKKSDYSLVILEMEKVIIVNFSNYKNSKKEWKTWSVTIPK